MFSAKFDRMFDKQDAALKLADERHDRLITTMNEQHRQILDTLKGLRLDAKDLRETQLAKRNGNGTAHAAKAAAKRPIVAYPLGVAAGGALIKLLEYLGG